MPGMTISSLDGAHKRNKSPLHASNSRPYLRIHSPSKQMTELSAGYLNLVFYGFNAFDVSCRLLRGRFFPRNLHNP